jgi:hypothetical protein
MIRNAWLGGYCGNTDRLEGYALGIWESLELEGRAVTLAVAMTVWTMDGCVEKLGLSDSTGESDESETEAGAREGFKVDIGLPKDGPWLDCLETLGNSVNIGLIERSRLGRGDKFSTGDWGGLGETVGPLIAGSALECGNNEGEALYGLDTGGPELGDTDGELTDGTCGTTVIPKGND